MELRAAVLAAGLLGSAAALAEVKELDGSEMIDTYVQGISIAQTVTDVSFDADDEEQRKGTEEQRNALGVNAPEVMVSNAAALDRPPSVDQLVRKIENEETRDLVEETIMQTSLSTRLDVNLDRVTEQTGVPVADAASKDFSVLRGSILELLPSATGYQLEFMRDRY